MNIEITHTYENNILEAEITLSDFDPVKKEDNLFMPMCYDFIDELRKCGISLRRSSYAREDSICKFSFSLDCTPREKELILRRLNEMFPRGG